MNTGLLYGKMLVTIFISLYSTRLVLSALGARDYGIFNLIAGVIAMLSFLNMAMTLSTQRYMSYNLGGGDMERLKKVFNASILLHLLLGLGLVLVFEVAGYFLFGHVLNIPPERVPAARVIYHFMVASAFVTIISVPYDATINARENMLVVALTGIAEALLKLAVALTLQQASADRLILFSGLTAATAIGLLLFKRVYCSVKYPESRIRLGRYKDKALLGEMFSYGGWNMFGAVSVVTAKDLEGKPVTSAVQALQGAAPNLIIQQNATEPGAAININVRGVSTVNNTSPLILVDGVPGSLDLLNPNDIESISVLKDAASSAIYGSRAANGVVLITTKRGKAGPQRISQPLQLLLR